MTYDLSFDPRDPLYDAPGLPGIRWGLQVFTTRNLYGLDPEQTQITMREKGAHLVCNGLSWAGQQQRSAGRVEADITWDDGALTWRVRAWHDEPVKSIKLMLWGLPDTVAAGWWQATSAVGETEHPSPTEPLNWQNPWSGWHTAWACAGEGKDAACVSIRDPEVRARRLYVHLPPYADGKPVVELVCEEDAMRWDGHFATPEMRLRICSSAAQIDADFEAHLAFIEGAYHLERWEARADVPAWMRDVRLVLNLHGQHWTGYVFNTFDRMAETLRFIAQHIPGERVLAYMPGWEGRYYFAYPHYGPGEAMGGPDAFRRLRETARELGVHLMPMFGANGANIQVYPDWERAVFRNRTDRYARLINCPDWDSDRSGEDDQVFLNPGEPTYRQHLLEQVSQAITGYDLEGVFLDTSACWFNDPRYNVYEGYRLLLGELRQRHPRVLFAGEGWWDALLALFPVNQSWLGVDRAYRYPQLLTRYARALGHLMRGTPVTGSTGVHEGGFFPAPPQAPMPGHIPALGIADDTLEKYSDEVARICRAANERKT